MTKKIYTDLNASGRTITSAVNKYGTGTGAPTFTTYSSGVRNIYYDNISGSSAGYVAGIEAGYLWHGVPDTTNGHKWYAGTTNIATLSGTGAFTITGSLSASGDVSTSGVIKSTASAGDEGGQIDLTKSVTNTTLTTGVSIDVYQNRLRFFETGGTNRGYYIDISGGGASVGTNLVGGGYTLPTATSTVLGGIELFSDTVQSTAANAVTTTSSRTYGIQVNGSGQGVINVPWTDTVYTSPLTLTSLATGFSVAGGTTSKTLTVSRTLTLTGTDSTTMTFPSTSATIARTDAAQTFTGVQTMTSPSITTSLTTGSTSFDLVNTTATTINFGGAATTMNIGSTTPGSFVDVGYDLTVSNNLDVLGSSTFTSAIFGGGFGNTGVTISTAGNIQADGNGTFGNLVGTGTRNVNSTSAGILTNSTSSARYKQDIADAEYVYEDILRLQPKTFKLKSEVEELENPVTYAGFIAEDVDEIDSLKVFVGYARTPEGELIPDSLYYAEMVSALVSAIKHQDQVIKSLESRIEALEGN